MTKITESKHPTSPTILIADPDENFRESFADLLKNAGIRNTCFASTGRETIETAAKIKPDLILLDRTIQSMDSFATLSNLKYLLPQTPIIMLVSFVDTSSLGRARELGMGGFYSKSIGPEELVQAVKSLLKEMTSNTKAQIHPSTPFTPNLDFHSKTKELKSN